MEELAEVSARQQTGTAQIDFSASGRRTKNLIEAHGLEKQLGGRKLLGNLDLLLRPGMRLGLVGANGSGKTTLLRMLKERSQRTREPSSGQMGCAWSISIKTASSSIRA